MLNQLNFTSKIFISSLFSSLVFIIFYLVLVNLLGWVSVTSTGNLIFIYGGLFVCTLISIGISMIITANVGRSIKRILRTVNNIYEGDLEARVGIKSKDEFGEISSVFDKMLNERVSALASIEEENEQLNDSIVELLETVAQISQKNLAIKATVNEDITGPLADALNMLTSETSDVLHEVTLISSDVAETSNLVKSQSDNVLILANNERDQIDKAISELKNASEAMNQIATLAESSNSAAETAIRSTITAMSTVTDTVDSINNIRETIHETEKRIKRLGERSQEISSAVNLINNISERTHILALNASMHAASAGEAGKGFAVVADEVQRLAESAKDSTMQISTLVNNIQVETAGAVNTMNELISKVVGGSQLAQQAGEKMKETQTTTAELVSMVQSIAQNAIKHTKTSELLRDRTDSILESVNRTGKHLKEQTIHTDELVEQAMSLVASVGVFKLKEDESQQMEVG